MNVTHPIHIIGCGAVGSTLAMMLTRAGITNMVLYDFDTVEEKNITNQQYTTKHIGKPKTQALSEILCEINPDIGHSLITQEAWAKGNMLSGYVFLCVDNIETRKAIVEDNRYNLQVEYFFDTRLTLTNAQIYTYKRTEADKLLNTMRYTQKEAVSETSACGEELGTYATVATACCISMANLKKLTQDQKTPPNYTMVNLFDYQII